jgi:hypothetical protein
LQLRFAAALLAALALPAAAQELPRTHTPRPTSARISAADAMTRLYILADDSMMGRQAGHRGNVMGTAYIASEFRRLGLEPAGTDGFFQSIPMVRKGLAEGAAASVGGQPLALWTDFAPLPALSNPRFPFQPELRISGVPVVFGGRLGGTMLPREQAAGKVVVLLPAMQGGQENYRFWLSMAGGNPYPEAKAIAIVALDISPPGIVEFLRREQTELNAETAAAAPTAAGMVISRAAAARLLGADPAGLQPGHAGGAISASFSFAPRPVAAPARNVIGLIRGSDPALRGQYVVIGAHNDHEGILDEPLDHDSVRAYNRVMRPQGANDRPQPPSPEQAARIRALADSLRRAHGGVVRMDSIMNGADDDGSGTVALLEIAESIAAGPRPRRSVLFVSHTAEEAGLLGSEHFTDHPTVPRDSIVAALNMDMVGRGRAEDIQGGGPRYVQLIGPKRLSTQLGAAIDSLNAARRDRMQIDYSFDAAGHPLNRYCRSDHFMYARYGIPITYFSRGYHIDYHMVGDEPQYIDYEGLASVAGFVGEVALAIANRPARLVVDGPRQDPNAPCRQ